MSDTVEPWTVERICAALGDHPDITKRIVSEINKTPAADLMTVFAKWQGLAERTLESVARARETHANLSPSGELPSDWNDETDRVMAEAAHIRAARHAA